MKEFTKILLIISYALVVSCTDKKIVNTDVKKYCILDTINPSGKLVNYEWNESESCPILYIGNLSDTIIIDHLLSSAPIPPFNPAWKSIDLFGEGFSEIEDFDSIKYQIDLAEYKKEMESYPLTKYLFPINSIQNLGSIFYNTVQIKVDTNFTISKIDEFNFKQHQVNIFEAYPIIITNQGKDTLLIGYQSYLDLSVEAKDSSGNWAKIIDAQVTQDVPMKESYMLLPGLSIISSTFKTSGEYTTKLRIKIGNNTSNEWFGNIDYNQFNSKFDENGEYKIEYIEQQKK